MTILTINPVAKSALSIGGSYVRLKMTTSDIIDFTLLALGVVAVICLIYGIRNKSRDGRVKSWVFPIAIMLSPLIGFSWTLVSLFILPPLFGNIGGAVSFSPDGTPNPIGDFFMSQAVYGGFILAFIVVVITSIWWKTQRQKPINEDTFPASNKRNETQ